MCPAGFSVSAVVTPYQQPVAPPTAVTQPAFAPLPSPVPAPTAEAQQLLDHTNALQPFLSVDEKGFHRLDVPSAKKAGVSGQAIAFGQQFVALNNRVVESELEGQPHGLVSQDFAFVEPLYRYYAESGVQPQQSSCGSRSNPDPCARRDESGLFFSTYEEAAQHLISLGYEPTNRRAGGQGAGGRDFTLPLPHACGFGTYRNQAIIRQR